MLKFVPLHEVDVWLPFAAAIAVPGRPPRVNVSTSEPVTDALEYWSTTRQYAPAASCTPPWLCTDAH